MKAQKKECPVCGESVSVRGIGSHYEKHVREGLLQKVKRYQEQFKCYAPSSAKYKPAKPSKGIAQAGRVVHVLITEYFLNGEKVN